jgi:mannose-6-phosphate isomerase-like protein (cupin superfamily)
MATSTLALSRDFLRDPNQKGEIGMSAKLQTLKVKKLADAKKVIFGPLSSYHPLIADGDTPVRTGIQIAEPGYEAQMHWHPYVEVLFILEGEAEVWQEGEEDTPVCLGPGDSIAIPVGMQHSFRTVGDKPMKLLGIHSNPERVVNYRDLESKQHGYPVLEK